LIRPHSGDHFLDFLGMIAKADALGIREKR
jgi:hypothetical protein